MQDMSSFCSRHDVPWRGRREEKWPPMVFVFTSSGVTLVHPDYLSHPGVHIPPDSLKLDRGNRYFQCRELFRPSMSIALDDTLPLALLAFSSSRMYATPSLHCYILKYI